MTAETGTPLIPEDLHAPDKLFPLSLDELLFISGKQLEKEELGPTYEPRIQHGDPEEKVLPGMLERLLHGTHAMTDIKPRVPERIENGIRYLSHLVTKTGTIEDHQIDIRKRKKLLASIAAQSHQCHRLGGSGHLRCLKTLQDKLVDKPAVTAEQGMTTQSLLPQLFQGFTLCMKW